MRTATITACLALLTTGAQNLSAQPLSDAPLAHAPLPDAPPPGAPLPDAPLPDAPLPDAPLPDAPLPDAIVWKQNVFSIPYRINRAPGDPDAPVETLLYVSADQGRTWELASRQSPDRHSFTFRAPRDGDYWFSLKTADRFGRMLPATPHRAELRVVVDSVPPRLDLAGKLDDGGKIALNWQAADPNLKPGSVRLMAQSRPDAPWQPLAIEGPPPAQQNTGTGPPIHSRTGQAFLSQQPGVKAVTVRAEVEDLAGNRTVRQTQIAFRPPAQPNASAKLAGSHTPPTDHQQRAPGDVQATNQPPATPPTIPAVPPDTQPSDNERSSESPADDANHQRWSADRTADRPVHRQPADSGERPSVESANQQPVESADATRRESNPSGMTSTTPPAPTTEIRWVRAPSFQLDYAIDAVDRNSVTGVVLWGTSDNGQTWRQYGQQSDVTQPLQARVDQQGIYGFRIATRTADTHAATAPQAGAVAELWVGVDWTAPRARLFFDTPDPAGDPRAVGIRWEASDPGGRLLEKPITLRVSRHAQGPWSTVTGPWENTGRYSYTPSDGFPQGRFTVRLDVTDRAGNQTTVISERSPQYAPASPTARIQDVRPLSAE